ncbi:MAG: helix-turn-helix domain-containing protein, partial [Methylophilaceae bacterium]|nr:helix-turn-helix domain-containing protein [Methylophilaceae bacterium]
MSKKELARLEVVQRVADGGLRMATAACQLKLSGRHVKRLVRAFRSNGAAGLVSKRRGKPSNNRIDPARKA